MRFERHLHAIYDRWLALPGNSNVPYLSVKEALYEIADQHARFKAARSSREFTISEWRTTVRLVQQNQWLTRFVRIWEYFEGKM